MVKWLSVWFMVATLDITRNSNKCLDFLFNKPDLLTKWINCGNQSEWKPIKNSIVRRKHLGMILLKTGKRRNKKGNATSSTTHPEKASRQPSALATASLSTNTLSRECIRLMKMKVLKLRI